MRRDFCLPHSHLSPLSTHGPTSVTRKGRRSVFLWGLWRRICGLYKFPPIVWGKIGRYVTPRLPCWWADLVKGLSSILPPVGMATCFLWPAEWEYTLVPSCCWPSDDYFPGCPDSESEHPGLTDSSDSESDILEDWIWLFREMKELLCIKVLNKNIYEKCCPDDFFEWFAELKNKKKVIENYLQSVLRWL